MLKSVLSCFSGVLSAKKPANDEDPAKSAAAILPNLCSESQPTPPTPSHQRGQILWESALIDLVPFALAIVSWDANQVLHKSFGREPAAAQLLSQAVHYSNTMKDTSMLAALLGSELGHIALQGVQQSGFWKGSMSVQLPKPHAPYAASAFSADACCTLQEAPEVDETTRHMAVNQHAHDEHLQYGDMEQEVLDVNAVGWVCPNNEALSLSAFSQPQPPCEPVKDRNTHTGAQKGSSRPSSQDDKACPGSWLPLSKVLSRSAPPRQGLAVSAAELRDQDEDTRRGLTCPSNSICSEGKGLMKQSSTLHLHQKNPLIMPEKAIEHLESGIASEECATRTVALLKSISQAKKSENGAGHLTSGHTSQDQEIVPLPQSVQTAVNATYFHELNSSNGSKPRPGHSISTFTSGSSGAVAAPGGKEGSGMYCQHHPQPSACESKLKRPSYVQSLDHMQAGVKQANECGQKGRSSLIVSDNPCYTGEADHSALAVTCPHSPAVQKGIPEPVSTGAKATATQSFDISIFKTDPTGSNKQVQNTLAMLAESQLSLLSSIIPEHAIKFLAMESTEAVAENVGQLARAHSEVVVEMGSWYDNKGVTLMFMDICGFTSMSKNVSPKEVMLFLNTLFSHFDHLTDVYGVHKVETAGDCYIVSGGIMSPQPSANGFSVVVDDQDPVESAERVMAFAKALLETAKQVQMPDTHEPVQVRVGLHTGDVVTGLIGSKLPKFSIFGDAMNTASRMESTGVKGRIHASESTYKLLQHEQWEPTGGIEVKGKGVMSTYLWIPPLQAPSTLPRQLLSTADSLEALPCMRLKRAHTLLQYSAPVPAIQPPCMGRQFSIPDPALFTTSPT